MRSVPWQEYASGETVKQVDESESEGLAGSLVIVRLDTQDHSPVPCPRRDGLMGHDVDTVNRELLEGIGHGDIAVAALDQEGPFALAEL